MTNTDITTEILDKLGWDYEKEVNPDRYKVTPLLYAGALIQAILNTRSIKDAAKSLGFVYKPFNTAVSRYLTPIFGNVNGGNETWYFILTHFVQVNQCRVCKNIKKYLEYHLDSTNSRGINGICKICRVVTNAEQYRTEVSKKSHQRSYEKHADVLKARRQFYKGERSKRIPPWYDGQRKEIEQFYANCPIGSQVDHKIPLRGKLVSGLHVIQNLQYLTIAENLSKSNKYEIV